MTNTTHIHALEFLTPDFVIQRVSPIKGNEKVRNLDLNDRPDITLDTAKRSLRLYREGKDPAVLSDPSKLNQGFRGIVMIAPVVRDENLLGFAGAVINVDLLAASLRDKEIRSRVDLSLRIGDAWLQKPTANKEYQEKDFTIFDKKITLGAGITRPFISYKRLLILYAWLTLIIGLVFFFRYVDRESKRLMSEISVISKERSNLQLLMEKILDASRLGVAALDGTGNIIMHNRQFKFFIDAEEAVVGNNFFEQEIPDTIKTHCRKILEAKSEQVESIEVAVKKDDRVIWYNCIVCCPRVDAKKYCYLITQDITIKKKLMQDRFEQQKLETVGQLAAGIAHDFNNILSASSGYLEVAQQKIDLGEISEANMYMQNIERMIDRAAGLVSNLLGYAKRGKTEAILVDLGNILTTLIEMARDTFPKNIEIVSSLPPDKLPIVADVNQIESAFLNILINARDAIEDAGTIKISGEIKTLSEMKVTVDDIPSEGRFIEITISDTGHGMPTEVLDRIFEPFFSTKRDRGGSGLGLSMCYGIFKSHGGYIFADSVEGKGSIFTIYLPLVEVDPEKSLEIGKTTPKKKMQKLSVLVIDDEEDIVKFLSEAIRARGHDISCATTCSEGIEIFRARKDEIDVILVDYGMPKMTGFECAKLLREIRHDVRIIMISGYTEEKLISPEIEKGTIEGFIKKPFRLQELFEMLEV
jgi:PAS domain S-box-containing protein